jgi:hypothetical protein
MRVRLLLLVSFLLTASVAFPQDMPDLFPNDEPDAIDPVAITDEFWSTGIFTQMIALIEGVFTESDWPLLEAALSLLHWLAVLEVVFTLVWLALSPDKQSVIGLMCGHLILIGFMVELVSQFPQYTQVWTDGCIWIGTTIGSSFSTALGSEPMTIAQFKDVGFIMLRGLTKLNQPYDYILVTTSHLGWTGILKTVPLWGPMMVCWSIAAVCFAGIGVQVFYTFVKLWSISTYAIPFLPFIVLQRTRNYGLMRMWDVLGVGARVGSLAALVGLIDGVMNRVTLLDPANITVGTYIMLAVLSGFFLVLSAFIPRKLERFISGPS